MEIINAALSALAKACAGIAAFAVGFTALFFVAEVVARYFFHSPLNWAGDNGSYMLLVTSSLAFPLLCRRRHHVAVTIAVDMLPHSTRRAFSRFLDFVVALVLITVSWYVLELCVRQYNQGILTPQANQIPRWWLSAIMSWGLILGALCFIFPAESEIGAAIKEA